MEQLLGADGDPQEGRRAERRGRSAPGAVHFRTIAGLNPSCFVARLGVHFYPEALMRVAFLVLGIALALVLAPALAAQNCRINSVDPDEAKIGDVVGATGESIDKAKVDELYLTDGTNDFKVEIVEQSDTLIKFKVPAKIKPGRYSLMLKTKGPDTKLLEQPVKMTVNAAT